MGLEVCNIAQRILKEDSKANIPKDREGFLKYLAAALKRGKFEYNRNYDSRNKDDVVRMKESYIGRKLTDDERFFYTSKWFNTENTIIDSSNSINQYDNYLYMMDAEILSKAIKTVFGKKQQRARDCYKAIFTVYCMDNLKDVDSLYPVLDNTILETCQKIRKTPTYSEIYQQFHPESPKNCAESISSKMLT